MAATPKPIRKLAKKAYHVERKDLKKQISSMSTKAKGLIKKSEAKRVAKSSVERKYKGKRTGSWNG